MLIQPDDNFMPTGVGVIFRAKSGKSPSLAEDFMFKLTYLLRRAQRTTVVCKTRSARNGIAKCE